MLEVTVDKDSNGYRRKVLAILKPFSTVLRLSSYKSKPQLEFDREKLQERLAKLSGGVAVIKVGCSKTELKGNETSYRRCP